MGMCPTVDADSGQSPCEPSNRFGHLRFSISCVSNSDVRQRSTIECESITRLEYQFLVGCHSTPPIEVHIRRNSDPECGAADRLHDAHGIAQLTSEERGRRVAAHTID